MDVEASLTSRGTIEACPAAILREPLAKPDSLDKG
jgi:hypothetical protein